MQSHFESFMLRMWYVWVCVRVIHIIRNVRITQARARLLTLNTNHNISNSSNKNNNAHRTHTHIPLSQSDSLWNETTHFVRVCVCVCEWNDHFRTTSNSIQHNVNVAQCVPLIRSIHKHTLICFRTKFLIHHSKLNDQKKYESRARARIFIAAATDSRGLAAKIACTQKLTRESLYAPMVGWLFSLVLKIKN